MARVRHKYDHAWRGTVLGSSVQYGVRDATVLIVEWYAPCLLQTLARADDLELCRV